MSVTFTHEVADGLHSATIKATKHATDTAPTTPAAGVTRALPLVDQAGC